ISSLILFVAFWVGTMAQTNVSTYSGEKFNSLDGGIENKVKATIIYDNYIHKEGMQEDWGYSLLLEGLNKTILFDTGTNPKIFKSNFEKLKLDASSIDEVFISHEHGDHFGGLHEFLLMNNKVKVVVPATFTKRFLTEYSDECAGIELISDASQICNHLYSTGVLGQNIPEQALVLNTLNGLVVMTGCSHPGIIEMLSTIKTTFKSDIYLVFGGFHLMNRSDKEIEKIIEEMKELGVKKCGATHCTGEKQIELFRLAFGKDFVEMGAGNVITFE
ncbi:MAG: MBL fold metallo-hydrolase, partial [Bacteroidales bacterium]|nr:MBL fold metallo-hydrolase [Bacteroidales bacterium]